MGWAGGSYLAQEIWSVVRRHVPAKSRKGVARKIIKLFKDEDCDTMEEAELLQKDADLPKEDDEDYE